MVVLAAILWVVIDGDLLYSNRFQIQSIIRESEKALYIFASVDLHNQEKFGVLQGEGQNNSLAWNMESEFLVEKIKKRCVEYFLFEYLAPLSTILSLFYVLVT